MPTVIDSLVLELGIDPKNLSTGAQAGIAVLRHFEAESLSSGRRIESETKRVSNVLADLRREAISTLGIFLGGKGIKDFLGSIVSLDASTGRLAKTFGMSAKEVSTWQGIFQQVGGTVESANSTLGAINGELVKFQTTGQTGMLGILNQFGVGMHKATGELKTAGELIFDLTAETEKRIQRGEMSQRTAAGLLGMLGISQDGINLILKGTTALREYEREARAAGSTTDESAAAAEKYQRSMSRLERSIQAVGRAIVLTFGESFANFLQAAAEGIQSLSDTAEQRAARLKKTPSTTQESRRRFGDPSNMPQWLKDSLNGGKLGQWLGPNFWEDTPAAPAAAPTSSPTASSGASPGEVEAYIRRAAAARGIDPEQAVRVARSEGLNKGARAIGDNGSSFGPFQLHYGRMAGGLNAVDGLGDKFTRKTGLHASDPSTWQSQVDFSLDEARKGGWGPWHGWRGSPFAGIGAPAAAMAGTHDSSRTNTTTVTISNLVVNAGQAKDAEGVAREIGSALERSVTAGAANYGPT